MPGELAGYILIGTDGILYEEYDGTSGEYHTVVFADQTNAQDAAKAERAYQWKVVPVYLKPKYKREIPRQKKIKRRNGYLSPERARTLDE